MGALQHKKICSAMATQIFQRENISKFERTLDGSK